ncbi:hypothetical protein BBK36DRAFT_1127217 [Trichoderma citrinoviride]|uniref:Uncharacterized protein n=1 Tax=Trichoderma citrinoviride TaxID=58853 RepID=A0A2T4B1Q2_9HYPO|nr:hypothetical protein BBK36DRAFT_1127217 [Trichoderma citrinoviride]PTB63131.1 hypothetical protein BBK36DRAFT_1127217 [Trichoderma citrinoviride]
MPARQDRIRITNTIGPPREDVDMDSFEYYLNLAMGQMEPQRPFAQWQQDSDTNGVTEAPQGEDEDFEGDTEMLGSKDKENDPSLLPANLPEPGRRPRRRQQQQPQPQPQPQPRLRPRRKVKLTDPELDFEIFEDETATPGQPFQREYYGSNVPALGELKNGEQFDYAMAHSLRQNYKYLMRLALENEDEDLYKLLINVYEDRYTTWQRFSGAMEWIVGCNPMDVWLWVEDKGYHKRWTKHQIVHFKEFLTFMNTCILNGIGVNDPVAAENLDNWNTTLITSRFKSLDLPNLHMVKNNEMRVSFMPNGPDEKLLYRADYTAEELAVLDAGWEGPGRWAPGEEPGPEADYVDEMFVDSEGSEREDADYVWEESSMESYEMSVDEQEEEEEESEREEADYVWQESSDLIAM